MGNQLEKKMEHEMETGVYIEGMRNNKKERAGKLLKLDGFMGTPIRIQSVIPC